MSDFCLDHRLQEDCHELIATGNISCLLHRNAEVAWFILVPHSNQTEFYQLDSGLQNELCTGINLLSEFITDYFDSDKINVATIGNVVSQLHVHVIGRSRQDAYWPDVVWGKDFNKHYQAEQLSSLRAEFKKVFNTKNINNLPG